MLTLRDIADQVGVSPSAVSLVLNDRDSGRVNSAVAERIRAVAAELGYVPNMLARGLRTKQSQTLGLLADGLASSPFSGEMLSGAQEAAWAEGYLLMAIDVDHHAVMQPPAVRALMQRNIEALIIAADFHREVQMPFAPRSLPVVLLDAKPPADSDPDHPVDSVVPDEDGGAYAAVHHLIEVGHRRIGFLGVTDPRFVAADQRRAGYRRALQEAGLAPDPALERYAPGPSTLEGAAAAGELVDRPDRPTAVFCFSDSLAMACYQVANRLGLAVPHQLSVVGFDNQKAVADALDPGLTTIQLPHRPMGAWAAAAAIRRMSDSGPVDGVEYLMPCPLVERGSVATASPAP
ncbi:LacI family DNA-binding transcriptional regulator [Ruania halotolerans]|uniref:LacI family DNA-binding transcriptional regulator n=1 Tax=Ruania halotolerans TaxID=2897773 RepID=UPI001E468B06|nr:LacI family DNA-binding transcriptional regulator [Ruania halotolerans]UFU06358.1 LacI family DNA-binding transcriptional regulator [Ruania halotolerans]